MVGTIEEKERLQKAFQKKIDALIKEYNLVTDNEEKDLNEIVELIAHFTKQYTELYFSTTRHYDFKVKAQFHDDENPIYEAIISIKDNVDD